jgi:hypothetical protein
MENRKTLTKEQQLEILQMITEGISYRSIMEKFGIKSTRTITLIKRKSENPDTPKTKKMLPARVKARISKTAQTTHIMNKSEIIVNEMIDILAAIKYSIRNLTEIQESQQIKSGEVVSLLEKLKEDIDAFLIATHEGSIKELSQERTAMLKRISLALSEAGNFYARDSIRIRAIGELRNQLETFVNMEIVGKGLEQAKDILNALFAGMNSLSDDSYIRYRDRVLELNPSVRILFARYEEVPGHE